MSISLIVVVTALHFFVFNAGRLSFGVFERGSISFVFS